VYDRLGSTTLFVGSSVVTLTAGLTALITLRTPQLDTPLDDEGRSAEGVPPEPGRV